MIRNRNITRTRICHRKDRDGNFWQTLVVKTDLSNPLETKCDRTRVDYRKLVSYLQDLQELTDQPFVGFQKIEIQGDSWRATL